MIIKIHPGGTQFVQQVPGTKLTMIFSEGILQNCTSTGGRDDKP